MGKSCKNCKHYSNNYGYCTAKEKNIIDKMGATYCNIYDEKRKVTKELVKCKNCTNLNKYTWCYAKKKCINEDEQEKERRCISFKERRKKANFVKKLARKK